MKKNYQQIILILIAIIIVSALFFAIKNFLSKRIVPVPVPTNLDEFTQCLNSKGAIMYGTKTCSVCKAQKELFGTSFQYVNYIECTEQTSTCIDAKIERVPTWIFSNGERVIGEQALQSLADKTGCELKVK